MVALIAVDGLTRCTIGPAGTKGSADSSSTQNIGETKSANGQDTASDKSTDASAQADKSKDAKDKGQSSHSGHASAESISRDPAGNCQISPQVADTVKVLLDNYWTYKAPLHQSFCKAHAIEMLQKKDPKESVENLIRLANAICISKIP